MLHVRHLLPEPHCHARQYVVAVYLIGLRQHLAVLCLLLGGSLAQLCARLTIWQQRLTAYDMAIGICCLAYPVTLPTVCKAPWRRVQQQGGRLPRRQHSGLKQHSPCNHCDRSNSFDEWAGLHVKVMQAASCSAGSGTLHSNSSKPRYPPWCMSQVHPDLSNVHNFASVVKSN